jgi:hypothetical protein
VQPQEPPTRIANSEPALIVAADGDPRTIYSYATALQKHLPNARMVTLKGARKHGIFGEYGSTCVDDKVITYLLTARLPANQSC